jgi:hypothetical protein
LKLLYCEPDQLLAFPKAFRKSGFGILLARIVRYTVQNIQHGVSISDLRSQNHVAFLLRRRASLVSRTTCVQLVPG